MKALLTGSTGFIGRHVVRELLGHGYAVRAAVRDLRKADALPEPVEVVHADLAARETLEGIADDVDVVIHLASVMRGGWDDFRRVDVEGSRALLDAAARAGVRRFVYASTLAVYPVGDLPRGSVVDRHQPTADPDRVAPYARAKLLVEEMVRNAHDSGALEGVILRPGLVYGPGSDPFLGHVPHLGKRRGERYVLFGDGGAPLPLTTVASTARAFRLAAEVPEAAGETFLLVDDENPTQDEYVRTLAELTGRPLRVTPIPKAVGWLAGLAAESLARLRGGPPKTSRRLVRGKWNPVRYDTSHARRVLGWSPAQDFRTCLSDAVTAIEAENPAGGARVTKRSATE